MTHNRFTALFRDHPGEPVPEENFCTLWCKGRLTEAVTLTIRLGATPSRLTSAHLHHPPIFYRPDALPAAQQTVSKHWRHDLYIWLIYDFRSLLWWYWLVAGMAPGRHSTCSRQLKSFSVTDTEKCSYCYSQMWSYHLGRGKYLRSQDGVEMVGNGVKDQLAVVVGSTSVSTDGTPCQSRTQRHQVTVVQTLFLFWLLREVVPQSLLHSL